MREWAKREMGGREGTQRGSEEGRELCSLGAYSIEFELICVNHFIRKSLIRWIVNMLVNQPEYP